MKLSELRQEYSRQTLDEKQVDADPFQQFTRWISEALEAQSKEPNAMTLSTVSANGQPHGRIVLLKGLEDKAFTFYTNYNSHKGDELHENNRAALTFFWPELERQVRIEGLVEKTDPGTSDTYFHSRPRGSQIGAWVSRQSEEIASRADLEKKLDEAMKRFAEVAEIPRPAYWGGYRLRPNMIEFWQGRPSRLHDRVRYSLNSNGSWQISRLSP